MIPGFFPLLLYHVLQIVYFADLKLNFSGLHFRSLIEIFLFILVLLLNKKINDCNSCCGENPLLMLP